MMMIVIKTSDTYIYSRGMILFLYIFFRWYSKKAKAQVSRIIIKSDYVEFINPRNFY